MVETSNTFILLLLLCKKRKSDRHILKNSEYRLFSRDSASKIWFPDLYIVRAKTVSVPTYRVPPAYLRVYPDGTLTYAAQVTLDLACSMDFGNYPVDVQRCKVLLESMGNERGEVRYSWKHELNQVRGI